MFDLLGGHAYAAQVVVADVPQVGHVFHLKQPRKLPNGVNGGGPSGGDVVLPVARSSNRNKTGRVPLPP